MKPTRNSSTARRNSLSIRPIERLEDRVLLDVAPVFNSTFASQYLVENGMTLGIDGYDGDGDTLTITAVSDNPGVTPYIPTGNDFAKLHFVDYLGADMGDIIVELFNDRSPTAVNRFVTLATNHVNPDGTLDPEGVPFYTNVIVHRVIPDFMIQTGDAEKGDGTGGSPLGDFPDYFDPNLRFVAPGALAMANSGPNTNDSQFFITDAPTPWLNGKHMIFGQMISGQTVYDTIINLPRNTTTNRPNNPPKMQYVEIYESTEDGSVTFLVDENFVGEAHVTISLDDGNGHVTQQVVNLLGLGQRPVIADPGDVPATPGFTKSFIADVVDDGGLPMDLTITASDDRITASINDTTRKVDILVPSDLSGIFDVTVTAVETGYSGLTPSSQKFHVLAQKSTDPQVLGRIPGPSTGLLAFETQQVGNLLYVAAGEAGLLIYDVTDPLAAVLLDSYDTSNSVRDVEVVGNTAFLTDTWGGFLTVNVSDPSNITLLDSIGAGALAVNVQIVDDIAFVSRFSSGFTAYNISDPANITQIGTLLNMGTSGNLNQAVEAYIQGDRAFVVDRGLGVVVVDISNPATMTRVNSFASGRNAWGIDHVGNTVYITEDDAISAWDITDVMAPVKLGSLGGIENDPWQITVINGVAVVGRTGGLIFVDVSDPAHMVQERTFAVPDFGSSATMVGSRLWLPAGNVGVLLMDTAGLFDPPNGVIDSPANGTYVNAGDALNLQSSWTDDANVVAWEWQVTGPENHTFNVEDPGELILNTAGAYLITLTVTNDLGLDDPSPFVVSVTVLPEGSEFPEGVIDSPADGATIKSGESVNLQSSWTDDGTIAQWAWTVTGPEDHTFSVEDPGSLILNTLGEYTITLVVTDDDGLSDQTPAVTHVTVISNIPEPVLLGAVDVGPATVYVYDVDGLDNGIPINGDYDGTDGTPYNAANLANDLLIVKGQRGAVIVARARVYNGGAWSNADFSSLGIAVEGSLEVFVDQRLGTGDISFLAAIGDIGTAVVNSSITGLTRELTVMGQTLPVMTIPAEAGLYSQGNIGTAIVYGAGDSISGNVVAKKLGTLITGAGLSGDVSITGSADVIYTGYKSAAALSGKITAGSINTLYSKGPVTGEVNATGKIATFYSSGPVSGTVKAGDINLFYAAGNVSAHVEAARTISTLFTTGTLTGTGSVIAGGAIKTMVVGSGVDTTITAASLDTLVVQKGNLAGSIDLTGDGKNIIVSSGDLTATIESGGTLSTVSVAKGTFKGMIDAAGIGTLIAKNADANGDARAQILAQNAQNLFILGNMNATDVGIGTGSLPAGKTAQLGYLYVGGNLTRSNVLVGVWNEHGGDAGADNVFSDGGENGAPYVPSGFAGTAKLVNVHIGGAIGSGAAPTGQWTIASKNKGLWKAMPAGTDYVISVETT
ncbi:MAG TPA: peptidylprolyl isomerase [Candidatus Brocadiia bacterium]|nr:peptidylprolyl isomerase [Candidatus Brocadiia bacterium]